MEEERLEEESIDGFGIDTEAEREQLNYRPSFERKPRMRGGVAPEQIVQPEVSLESDDLTLGNGLVTSVIESWIDTKEWIISLHDDLRQKLRDVTVSVKPSQIDNVKEAANQLGAPYTNAITVELYERALESLDTIHGELIATLWEEAAEDLEGSLAMEFFADTKALKDEIPMLDLYTQKTLFEKLGLSTTIAKDQLEQLEEAEKKHGELVENLAMAERTAEASYMNQILFGELEDVRKTKAERRDVSYYTNQIRHMRFGMQESVQVMEEKVSLIDRTLYLIRDNVEQKPYAEQSKQVLLGAPEATREKDNEARMKVLLKTSLDAQNRRRDQQKHSLTQVYTPKKRALVMGELINDVNIFEEVSLPVHHQIGGYDQKLGGVGDVLLNDLMRAVSDSFDTREKRQKEWYGLVMAEAETRRKKVLQTIEKDSTRQGYHLIADSR